MILLRFFNYKCIIFLVLFSRPQIGSNCQVFAPKVAFHCLDDDKFHFKLANNFCKIFKAFLSFSNNRTPKSNRNIREIPQVNIM